MEKIEVEIVSAFTRNNQGGNQAGIVHYANSLPRSMRQQIAAEINLSETAFLSERENDDPVHIEFYTPVAEVARCGHATVAAASTFEEESFWPDPIFSSNSGKIQLKKDDEDRVFYSLKDPIISELSEAQHVHVLNIFSVSAQDVSDRPIVSDVGVPFITLELKSLEVLQQLSPNMDLLRSFSHKAKVIGAYVYVMTEAGTIEARMFAPAYGIEEESATGMGAGAAAATLRHAQRIDKHLTIFQGHLMKKASPSELRAVIDADASGKEVWWVGGTAQDNDIRILSFED